uniref:Phosphoribosylaminoimidazole-succinocarboxamide synthase n=1 Tax=Geoglobus ahangari TaxID=113653 RepID=A0A7C3YHR2_9EURY
MGSVKDLEIIRKPDKDKHGIGRFHFSDRYSVFDYGEMPDTIENKGKALCMLSAYFFEILEKEGIKTHYIGLIKDSKLYRFNEIDEPTNIMEIKLVNVVRDYDEIKKLKGNFLIPLEVIYRNTLPEGSSIFKRLERGEIKPEDLGLKEMPKPGQVLEEPIIDFSTKLEDIDRYLKRNEAMEITGLSEEEMENLIKVARKIDEIITRETRKAGILNEDGKIEFAFDENRELMVVDAVGTPDECRFRFEETEISKEILRKHYRKTEWYRRIQIFKGEENWRKLVGKPPRLPKELREAVSQMYMSCCNEITGRKIFDSPSLKEVVRKIREVLDG